MISNDKKPSVLLVSIDALKPEFIFEQERLGISLPNIKKYFIENGTYSRCGVRSVFPTFTYPCHQSIITGTNPAKHGIFNNGIFDPKGIHNGAWHWFASEKVDNLWKASKENGYVSASVAFPTSVCAEGDFIVPEFWWDGTEFDSYFINALSKPQGIISKMEKEIGRYAGGLDLTEEGDEQRFKATMWVLKNKIQELVKDKPFFMTSYFASFDEMAHVNGVYSKEAAHALEKIDKMLGILIKEVHEITNDNVVVCVVSDHGTLDNEYNINPNMLLKEAGLIDVDECGNIISWKAWAQRAGGTAEIRVKDSEDAETIDKLKKVIEKMTSDEESGILEVLDREEAKKRGGFPLAEFVLVAKKGYEIRENVLGDYCTTKLAQKAQHGYSENFEEMKSSFLIEGKGIKSKQDIGEMNLIDIAPTLANIMGFVLSQAEGKNIL
ncbi:alkaline phosphatase family protein [Clostridium sardiniense]|uniref:alkaline phosphatase family protein n=1 Tax=Clostridium sardiniense TaxID=29369 RepID=UPI003D343D31